MKILIVLPVYNEEIVLRENTLKLYDFLKKNIQDEWQIVIADNGSFDKTPVIGQELAEFDQKKISYFYIPQRGRGGAIQKAWLDFKADLYAFMDCDLATDLKYFPPLIEEIKRGNDIVIGSRLMQTSDTKRSLLRESTSRIFNFLLKTILNFEIKDSQCGFKGATYDVVKKITPQVRNHDWFFDTEFLFLAQKNGFKIKEIPVRWIETPNRQRKSKVNVLKTSINYLKEIWRLKKHTLSAPKMSILKQQSINLKTISLIGLLLASYLALFLIPYLRKIFNDQNLPAHTSEIIIIFFLISALQIISYYLFLDFFQEYFKKHFKIFLVLVIFSACIFIILPSQGSVDLFNNIFYAKIIVNYGENPYLHPIKEFTADIFYPFTNPYWRGVTPYGPAWTLLSLIPYKISGPELTQKILAFRLFNFLFWTACGYLIFLILKKIKPNLSHQATLFYFFNPLILFEAGNNSHNDIVFAFFILLAIYFYLSNKKVFVLPILIISFLAKYVSLIIMPFFLWPMLHKSKFKKKRSLLISIFLSLTVLFLILLPFSFNWKPIFESLANQTTNLYNAYYFSSVPFFLSAFLPAQQFFNIIKYLSFALFAFIYIFLLNKFLRKETIVTASFWTLSIFLFIATFWLQPWYFIWLIPLAVLKLDNPFFKFLLFALSLAGLWSYIIPLGLLLLLLAGVIIILKFTKQKNWKFT